MKNVNPDICTKAEIDADKKATNAILVQLKELSKTTKSDGVKCLKVTPFMIVKRRLWAL